MAEETITPTLPEFQTEKPAAKAPDVLVDEVRKRTGRSASMVRQVIYGTAVSAPLAKVIDQVRVELGLTSPPLSE